LPILHVMFYLEEKLGSVSLKFYFPSCELIYHYNQAPDFDDIYNVRMYINTVHDPLDIIIIMSVVPLGT
jgi:hypothetical protein